MRRLNLEIPSMLFWPLWHVASVVLVVVVPLQLRFGQPLLHLPTEKLVEGLVLGVASLVFSLFLKVQGPQSIRFLPTCIASLVCFGTGAFFLYTCRESPSRWIILGSAGLGITLAVFPYFLRRHGLFVLLALIGAATLAIVPNLRAPVEQNKTLWTSLNSVVVTYCRGLVAPVTSDGGAIVKYGEGFLLVTGSGEFYRLEWSEGPLPLKSTRLSLPAPMDRAAMLADQPEYQKKLRLRVMGLAVDTSSTPARIYVAHQSWNRQEKAFHMSVSMAVLPASAASVGWTTIFDSQPGLAYGPAFDDIETGGRLAFTPEGKLLVTIGDHGFDGRSGVPPLAQAENSDYGKTVMLDGKGGHEHFTSGHRNPQGLTVDRKGRIWETEHGPQGGDEINLLHQGTNYGWPFQTYGTDYGHTYWPVLAPEDTGQYQKPVHAFVPSVAISDIIELGPKMFGEWEGDLLVGSLRLQSLYRVRLDGDRVVYVEPIRIEHRLRALAQGKDGRIVLWDDTGVLIVLTKTLRENTGQRLYGHCIQCHEPVEGMPTVAPSLHSVLGRSVASERRYNYSPALSKLGGAWSEERLSQFLENPAKFAPGTMMKFEGIADSKERKALIEFLKEYR